MYGLLSNQYGMRHRLCEERETLENKPGENMVDQNPTQESIVPVDFGGEAFLEAINNNGVEYVFTNSGTDTSPIQDLSYQGF